MEKEVLNLKEAANLLGTSIRTLKEMLDFYKVEYKQFGTKYFITKRSILDLVDGGQKEAAAKCESKTSQDSAEN